MPLGFIYLLTNPAMPGYVKIGYSTRVPDSRAGELSEATGVPQPFILEYWCLTEDVEAVEKNIHEALSTHRVATNREFFQLTVANALTVVEELIKVTPSRYVRPPGGSIQDDSPTVKCPFCGALGRSRLCSSCGGSW